MTEFERQFAQLSLERVQKVQQEIEILRQIGGRMDLARAAGLANAELTLTIQDFNFLLGCE